MKKLLLALSIVILLVSCNNGGMEDDNGSGNDGKGDNSQYYPYEVTNVSHEVIAVSGHNIADVIFKWDNPKDDNFSYVIFKWHPGLPEVELGVGVNTWTLTGMPHYQGVSHAQTATIQCANKDGLLSNGIKYRYEF